MNKLVRKILRDHIFSGGRFILGFTKNLTTEKEFLERLDLKVKTVYDVGCASGLFSMFFSRSVGKRGKVVAFEPLPLNYEQASYNFEKAHLKNISIHNIGLGAFKENRLIAFKGTELATASMDSDIYEDISKDTTARTLMTAVDTLDNIIIAKNLPMPDFIKIDVEGMELEVLNGMEKTMVNRKPQLFIEIHGLNEIKKIRNIESIVEFLSSKDYKIFHVESTTKITKDNSSIAKEGHIYCT